MKKYLLTAVAASVLTGMAFHAEAKKTYGKTFAVANVQTPEQLTEKMQKNTLLPNVVVKGAIAQVCQAEGCWLKLRNTAGDDILVKFKDHSFVVPKNLTGVATVYGTATKKTISVDEQRHMAEDAGKSDADIAAITAPKTEVRIESTGIIVDQ
jgi:hypothetical protein